MNEFEAVQRTLGGGIFVPFTQHKNVPIPMPVAGRGSDTFTNAKRRCEVMLETGNFTHAWVVTHDEVIEVTL